MWYHSWGQVSTTKPFLFFRGLRLTVCVYPKIGSLWPDMARAGAHDARLYGFAVITVTPLRPQGGHRELRSGQRWLPSPMINPPRNYDAHEQLGMQAQSHLRTMGVAVEVPFG